MKDVNQAISDEWINGVSVSYFVLDMIHQKLQAKGLEGAVKSCQQ